MIGPKNDLPCNDIFTLKSGLHQRLSGGRTWNLPNFLIIKSNPWSIRKGSKPFEAVQWFFDRIRVEQVEHDDYSVEGNREKIVFGSEMAVRREWCHYGPRLTTAGILPSVRSRTSNKLRSLPFLVQCHSNVKITRIYPWKTPYGIRANSSNIVMKCNTETSPEALFPQAILMEVEARSFKAEVGLAMWASVEVSRLVRLDPDVLV